MIIKLSCLSEKKIGFVKLELATSAIQSGLEFRTCSDFGWSSVFGSWLRPFENRTMGSLGRFIRKKMKYFYIKRPRLIAIFIAQISKKKLRLA